MEIQKASPYRFLAYISSIMMIIGANLPQYFVKGNSSGAAYVFDINNEGVFLYVSAIIVIMMRYCKWKKYILAPIIFQVGMMVYYIIFFTKSSEFEMVHIGFVLEASAVVFLIISMFVNINIKKEVVHDMCTLNIKPIEEDEYVDNVTQRDIPWILITAVITVIMVVLKVKII